VVRMGVISLGWRGITMHRIEVLVLLLLMVVVLLVHRSVMLLRVGERTIVT